jgi:dolichyl-phosphate beta-glucosyltransferase
MAVLEGLGEPSELIVVDDGSADGTAETAEAAVAAAPENVAGRVLRHGRNRGKGAAVRTGCLATRGRYVAFIDADLATPPEEIVPLLQALKAGADVAIGVRTHPDGSDMRSRRPLPRRLAGWLFAQAMRILLLPDVTDSQCPVKAFRREAAQQLFGRQRIDTWAFDAEILFLARRLGLRVAKVPVRWQAVPGSHFRFNVRSLVELWNLVRIRLMHRGVSAASVSGELPEPVR